MPYPSPPEIATSYTAVEQGLGNGTFPGQEVDVDLANLRASVTAVIEFLKTSLRSDGRLANGSVSSDTLASSLVIGFDPPQVWATGTTYTTSSTVFEGFGFYLCTVAHTSGTFATDLASGRWALLADLTPPGGALIASNNLSDVPDKAAARSTLGLGTLATVNSGTGASDVRTNLQNEAIFQPLDAELTAIAGLTSAADRLPYFTGSGTAALATFTAAGRALVDDADAAAQRTTLGAQASNATLTSLSGLSLVAGDVLYATGANTLARLAAGTARQVLQMNSGATAPEWTEAVGMAQTWQDLTASRAFGTSYQNTTGGPITFNPRATTAGASHISLETSPDNSTWTVVYKVNHNVGSTFTDSGMGSVVVPDTFYYRCRSVSGTNTLTAWMELRP